MATGGSQRYGVRDPLWFREPDFQALAGINPLGNWINGLLAGPTTRPMRAMSSRAGNTAPLQSFHKTTGAAASINNRDDITASARQHTRANWGTL